MLAVMIRKINDENWLKKQTFRGFHFFAPDCSLHANAVAELLSYRMLSLEDLLRFGEITNVEFEGKGATRKPVGVFWRDDRSIELQNYMWDQFKDYMQEQMNAFQLDKMVTSVEMLKTIMIERLHDLYSWRKVAYEYKTEG